MDLSFSAAERAFADEVGGWPAQNVEVPPRVASIADEVEYGKNWQAKLAAGRRDRLQCPEDDGGRRATPIEVALPNVDQLVGALHEGWAVANTTLAHERGTAFPFKEQVVHEVYLDELWQLAVERSAIDDVEIADALAQSFVDLRVLRLHNWRTLSRLA